MRYLIRFSYDGTLFYGYQRQPNLRTVEECLEKALYDINNHKKAKIISSGRTDKGVHAKCQTACFDLEISITLDKLKMALNSLLPDDIHVFSVEVVDENFHARYMVKEKTYQYILNMGEYNPLERNYIYQLNRKLDVEKMKIAIKFFLGEHDFSSFVSNECVKDNYNRTIYDCSIEEDSDKLVLNFTGNGFMKYQVRNMVGTLIKIGLGKLDVDIIDRIFEDESLEKYVFTAPSEGLYLVKVDY